MTALLTDLALWLGQMVITVGLLAGLLYLWIYVAEWRDRR